MKIAIPSKTKDGATVVDAHFGHCEFFTILTIDDSKTITASDRLVPPGGCGCKSNLAPTLAEMNVSTLLAGNMGQGAVNVLAEAGVEALRGWDGPVDDVVKRWLAGEVIEQPDICDHEDHDGLTDLCHHHH